VGLFAQSKSTYPNRSAYAAPYHSEENSATQTLPPKKRTACTYYEAIRVEQLTLTAFLNMHEQYQSK